MMFVTIIQYNDVTFVTDDARVGAVDIAATI